MNEVNNDKELLKQTHPYKPFIPDGAKALILGSAPPYRFCVTPKELQKGDFDFYYGSMDNSFWTFVLDALDVNIYSIHLTVDNIKEVLEAHRIAVADLLNTFTRRGHSALDKDLMVDEVTEVFKLLADNSSITSIFLTSQQVSQWFKRIIRKSDPTVKIIASGQSPSRDYESVVKIEQNERSFCCHVLYSPSPNGLRGIGNNKTYKELKNQKQMTTNQFRIEDYRNQLKSLRTPNSKNS